MKAVSFNTNGIRAREHQLEKLIANHAPDIIGIQETKAQNADFPVGMIEKLGYHPYFHGQKGHYGVAFLSKDPLHNVRMGYPNDTEEDQKRMIMADWKSTSGETVTVLNGYFPQGESRIHPTKFPCKAKFYTDLYSYLDEQLSASDHVIVMGDFNVCPEDQDIGIGEDNRKRWLRDEKTSFLPEEREWLEHIKSWGLTDSYRHLHPTEDSLFSWFDYRSKGFDREPKRGLRIDYLLTTDSLTSKIIESGIDYEIRSMEKPSDHCPVWTSFDI